jgi:hypothetical protein
MRLPAALRAGCKSASSAIQTMAFNRPSRGQFYHGDPLITLIEAPWSREERSSLDLNYMGATSSCSEFTCATRPDLHRLTSESTATSRWTLFRTTHDARTVSRVLTRITSDSSAHAVGKTARSGPQKKKRRSFFWSFRSQTSHSPDEPSVEQISEESTRDGRTWGILKVEECRLRLVGNSDKAGWFMRPPRRRGDLACGVKVDECAGCAR